MNAYRHHSYATVPMLAVLAVTITACAPTPEVVKRAAPPIRTLADRQQPNPAVLPIIPSPPVAPDAEKALENYRAVLALHPDAQTRAEVLRRIADLEVALQDRRGNPQSGRDRLGNAIDIYRELLKTNPQAAGNDRLLYQMARAYQNSGDTQAAIAALRSLEARYPDSSLIGDAHFRAGELLFQTRRYAAAAEQYRYVIDLGPGSTFFEPAQYKYGWSLFKQGKYRDDIAVFLQILDRYLPPGRIGDPDAALRQVPLDRRDLVQDVLRVTSLSFAALGGGAAVNDYFARFGEPAYSALIYNALGRLLLARQRYTDAAQAYAAFVTRHPRDERAPAFQRKVIAAYAHGGFDELALHARERYATDYAPGAAYWNTRRPDPAVIARVRRDSELIARAYQARAQRETAGKTADFTAAARWYRRIIRLYPQDPQLPHINLLLADSLYDAGRLRDAAVQYEITAYRYGVQPQSADAAYAAVQAWQQLADRTPPAQRATILERAAESGEKLAARFPHHPRRDTVLAQTAVDWFALGRLQHAIGAAERMLGTQPAAGPELRRTAYGVIGDVRFKQRRYADAQAAYLQVLQLTSSGDPRRSTVVAQLAATIFKQAQSLEEAGQVRQAAETYLHIGQLVPESTLRNTADYNAAADFIRARQWNRAEAVLEAFRSRAPGDKLIPRVDEKLAYAYQQDGKPDQAAPVFERIAARSDEPTETRREAAWLAAQLYQQAGDARHADIDYRRYLERYPLPLDRAIIARWQLAELAAERGDRLGRERWLHDIVVADTRADAAHDDVARLYAARASLALGRAAAERAAGLRLTQPLAKTLARRKTVTEQAVHWLTTAAGYGVADITTAATAALGEVYEDLGHALEQSQPPPRLNGDALTQYQLLLQAQAEPFFERAIQAHEANLHRVADGYYDAAIGVSVDALARLSPGKYAKRERAADYDDRLR